MVFPGFSCFLFHTDQAMDIVYIWYTMHLWSVVQQLLSVLRERPVVKPTAFNIIGQILVTGASYTFGCTDLRQGVHTSLRHPWRNQPVKPRGLDKISEERIFGKTFKMQDFWPRLLSMQSVAICGRVFGNHKSSSTWRCVSKPDVLTVCGRSEGKAMSRSMAAPHLHRLRTFQCSTTCLSWHLSIHGSTVSRVLYIYFSRRLQVWLQQNVCNGGMWGTKTDTCAFGCDHTSSRGSSAPSGPHRRLLTLTSTPSAKQTMVRSHILRTMIHLAYFKK